MIDFKIWWIVENTDKEGETFSQNLITEVRRQKILCKQINDQFSYIIPRPDFLNGIEKNDCVLIHGSVQLVRKLQTNPDTKLWVPHSWCSFEEMKCSFYYPRLSEFLLNKNYLFLPLHSLLERKEWIFEHIGTNRIFIKPDSGTKAFTGFSLTKNEFDKEISDIISNHLNENIFVLIAPFKNISAEWRLVIADKTPITGSQYMADDEVYFSSGIPSMIYDLAKEVASKQVFTDKMYTVDICLAEKEIKLLEINSFSSSCFYDSNVSLIVSEAKRLAKEEWNEYNITEGLAS